MSREQLEFVEVSGELLIPAPPAKNRVRWRLPARFAGFRLRSLAFGGAIVGLLVWNAWITRELVTLKRHRIVSVSLASLITDFVHDQARQQGSAEEAAFRTKLYLVATQKALLDLGKDGTPVLASEAVLGNSVPDETARLKAAVARATAAQADRH